MSESRIFAQIHTTDAASYFWLEIRNLGKTFFCAKQKRLRPQLSVSYWRFCATRTKAPWVECTELQSLSYSVYHTFTLLNMSILARVPAFCSLICQSFLQWKHTPRDFSRRQWFCSFLIFLLETEVIRRKLHIEKETKPWKSHTSFF